MLTDKNRKAVVQKRLLEPQLKKTNAGWGLDIARTLKVTNIVSR